MLILLVGLAVVAAFAGAALAFAICVARFKIAQKQNLEILRGINETRSIIDAMNTCILNISCDFNEIRLGLTRMEDARRADAEARLSADAETVKSFDQIWTGLEQLMEALFTLLKREDLSEGIRRIEQLLTEVPGVLTAEDEAAMSKAMEEGISNLLGYSVGKGPVR